MAPRRGGGGSSGGSSGGSGPVCPGFLSDYKSVWTPVVYFVAYCLFFVLTLGVLVYTCCVRKRSNKLIRLLFIVLAFMSIGWALVVLGTILRECWVLDQVYDYYNFMIAFDIFFNIGQWILLFIVVWGVNRLLSQRLSSGHAFVQVVTLAIAGVMAALTAGYTGVSCYNAWQLSGPARYDTNYKTFYDAQKLAVAFDVLYILSVVAGGAISVALLMQIRSKGVAINVVIKRIVAVVVCMVLWNIFVLVVDARTLEEKYLELDTNTAMYYLNGFFQIFSYLAIISLCKSNFWKESATQTAYNTTGYDQPAYAPVQPPPQQQQVYYAGPMAVNSTVR